MSGFGDGVRAFTTGLGDVRQPGVRRYVIAPAAASFLIISSILAVAFAYMTDFTTWLESQLPSWLDFLSVIITPLVYLFGTLLCAWLAGLLAVMLVSPFLGNLSQAVDRHAGRDSEVSNVDWTAAVPATLRREWTKLRYHLPRLIGLLVVSVIPLTSPLAPLLWWGFGSWMMAVQFADLAAESRAIAFPDALDRLRANRATCLGFGIPASFVLALPFLNFLFVPVVVAGGTRLWHALAPSETGRSDQTPDR